MMSMLNLAGFGMSAWDASSHDSDIPLYLQDDRASDVRSKPPTLIAKVRANALIGGVWQTSGGKHGGAASLFLWVVLALDPPNGERADWLVHFRSRLMTSESLSEDCGPNRSRSTIWSCRSRIHRSYSMLSD